MVMVAVAVARAVRARTTRIVAIMKLEPIAPNSCAPSISKNRSPICRVAGG